MEPQPSQMKPSSRRAARLRSRIVFFLLRRALRRLVAPAAKLPLATRERPSPRHRVTASLS